MSKLSSNHLFIEITIANIHCRTLLTNYNNYNIRFRIIGKDNNYTSPLSGNSGSGSVEGVTATKELGWLGKEQR